MVFSWECLRIEGTAARLNVSLLSNESGENINLSTILNVDTETRDVTLLNGSAFGKTLLWLPANPKDGEAMTVDGVNVEVHVSGTTDTLQGHQRIFIVTNWRLANQSVPINAFYDLDTGVRILGFGGDEWVFEGTIKALGIKNRWLFISELSQTNIDLGPQELWPVIGRYLVFAPLVAVFIIVPVFILRRRQKRARMNARLKSRKKARREQDPDLDL